MAKSTYKNFIKSYDTIRKVLRYMYLYGCYSREDFEEVTGIKQTESKNSISGRKYDNERRRIMYSINEKFLNENFVRNTKYIGFKYDMFKNSQNYLFDSYKIKAFSANDINYFFLIQQILQLNPNGLSITEIMDFLSELIPQDIDISTIRRKINGMITHGLIISKNERNKKKFIIIEDFLKDFTTEEVVAIFYSIQFYCNIALVSVPGYYFKETIKNYLKYERDCSFEENEIFMFKHFAFNRMIEDDIVFNIISCIMQNKKMKFSYEKTNKKAIKVTIIPLKIITEYYYGRQYVFGIDSLDNKAKIYRIDKIDGFSVDGDFEEKANTSEYDKYLQNSWCAVLLNSDRKLIEVEVDFIFDELKEQYVLKRLLRERKWGEVVKIEENHYLYRVKVTDPNELKPWLRSYAGFAKIRKSESHDLYETIKNDWKEALQRYGVV